MAVYKTNEPLDEKTSLSKYSKGLPHNNKGVANLEMHSQLLNALKHRHRDRVEDLCRDLKNMNPGNRLLVEPTAAFTSNIPRSFWNTGIPKAPDTYSSEKAEEYKDVAFWTVNRQKTFEQIEDEFGTERTRVVDWEGVDKGPFVSQFFLMDFDFGMSPQTSVFKSFQPNDFNVKPADYLACQNGERRSDPPTTAAKRIQTPQDFASYVRRDKDQVFTTVLHSMLGMGMKTDKSWLHNSNADVAEDFFPNFGPPSICCLMQRTLKYSLQKAWFTKWHYKTGMHVRPEEYAGILHFNSKYLPQNVADSLKEDQFVKAMFDKHGTYLLPMVWPHGSPVHPEHVQGHSSVSMSVATMLKMIFDEDQEFDKVRYVDTDGTLKTRPNTEGLTVHGELNKLAYNVGIARVMAGVHFNSSVSNNTDWSENVAEAVMQMEMAPFGECYVEYTAFDGTKKMVKTK